MTYRKPWVALILWLLAAATAHAQPSPFVVTSTADTATVGTLRFALQIAASSCLSTPPPSPILITFGIAGTGPFKIRPATPLPAITCSTTIDGYSQPGSSANTNTGDGTNAAIQIEIDGSLCGTACTVGFNVAAPGAFFQGLSIHSFQGPAISATVSSSLQVAGNFIGTDTLGNAAGNQGPGLDLASGIMEVGGNPSGCTGANPGLPLPGTGCRNLISGNSGAGINIGANAFADIINNLIGGTGSGAAGFGNGGAGIASANVSSSFIGTNYIRFNGGAGVAITGGGRPNIEANFSIFNNGAKGIDYGLAGSPYPPPVPFFVYDPNTNTTAITATVTGAPPPSLGPYFIDLYSNSILPPFGEGESLQVAQTPITIDASGNGSVGPFTVVGKVTSVTGTLTVCGDGCLGTSEFSTPYFPPSLDITFTPNPVALGNSGAMAMVLSNPNKTTRTLGQVSFSFSLPTGLTIGAESIGADCAPGLSIAGASGTTAAVSSVTLPPGTTCSISATVTPSAGGTYNFAAGSIPVPSDAGFGTNSAASFTVTTTPSIGVSPSSLAFGTLQTGTSSSQTVTVTSNGTAPLDVTGAVTTGAGFAVTGNTCTTGMAPGTTCIVTVTFSPTTVGPFTGQLTITSSATPSTATVALNGAGGAPGLQFVPATLTFPTQNVGTTSAPQNVSITNTGSTALNITAIAAVGDFGFTGCGVPLTLAPGASCALSVTFSPQANGAATGSIRVTSNGPGSPNVLPLSGTGAHGPTPGIAAQPFSVGMGTIRVGTQATAHVSIVSNGSAPLALAGITVSGAFFSQANACPATLPVGASCDVTITYSPTATGSHGGQLLVQSNASPPTLVVALSGASLSQLPAALSVPGSLDFGPQIVGTTTRLDLVLSNSGEQPLNISSVTVQGTGFSVEGACTSIAGGESCRVTLVFQPTAVASFTGGVRIASNDSRGAVGVSLSGEGVALPRAEIALSPDGVGFANEMVTTQSRAQLITVTSSGTAPLHIGGVSADSPFRVTGNTCPTTLAPGATCTVSVSFVPFAVGGATGRLTVDSDAAAGRGFTSLSGNACGFFSVQGMRNLVRLCP